MKRENKSEVGKPEQVVKWQVQI